MLTDEQINKIVDEAIVEGYIYKVDYAWYYVGEDNARQIIADAIRKALQQSVQADGAYCRCGDVGYGDKFNRCVTCGQFKSPRR